MEIPTIALMKKYCDDPGFKGWNINIPNAKLVARSHPPHDRPDLYKISIVLNFKHEVEIATFTPVDEKHIQDILRRPQVMQKVFLARYKYALEDMTPCGSEFYNEPEKCAAHILDRIKTAEKKIRELMTWNHEP